MELKSTWAKQLAVFQLIPSYDEQLIVKDAKAIVKRHKYAGLDERNGSFILDILNCNLRELLTEPWHVDGRMWTGIMLHLLAGPAVQRVVLSFGDPLSLMSKRIWDAGYAAHYAELTKNLPRVGFSMECISSYYSWKVRAFSYNPNLFLLKHSRRNTYIGITFDKGLLEGTLDQWRQYIHQAVMQDAQKQVNLDHSLLEMSIDDWRLLPHAVSYPYTVV